MAILACCVAAFVCLVSSLLVHSPLSPAWCIVPFVLLGIAAFVVKSKGREVSLAAAGAALPILWFSEQYFQSTHWRASGGGADIGLRLLFLGMPFLMALGAGAGWAIGWFTKWQPK